MECVFLNVVYPIFLFLLSLYLFKRRLGIDLNMPQRSVKQTTIHNPMLQFSHVFFFFFFFWGGGGWGGGGTGGAMVVGKIPAPGRPTNFY